MADWRVVIPSYRRAQCLANRTLPLLLSRNVPIERISVWVADEEEAREYEANLPNVDIRIGAVGIAANRAAIHAAAEPGEWLVHVDDDLDDVISVVDPKTTQPVTDLSGLIDTGFRLMQMGRAHQWGVSLVPNPYFMRQTFTYDLRYVCGGFVGVVVSRDPRLRPTVPLKEDMERTILYHHVYGETGRFNGVALVTKCFTEPGGNKVHRTPQLVGRCTLTLANRWPQYVTLNAKKATKAGPHAHLDLRFSDKTKRKVHPAVNLTLDPATGVPGLRR